MLWIRKIQIVYLLVFFVLAFPQPSESTTVAQYCWHALSKLSEIPYNDFNRINEIFFRVDLSLSKKSTSKGFVKLSDLNSIHRITFPPAIQKTNLRAMNLIKHQERILAEGGFSISLMNEFLPSKNSIRAIKDKRGEWVVFDGNGRLEAIRTAFVDHPNLLIEVQLLEVENEGVLALLDRVRRGHGLLR